MSKSSFFVEEVAAFLRPWSSEWTLENGMLGHANPIFYFPQKKLIVHCVSLASLPADLLPTTFVDLTDKWAVEGIKIIHLWEDVWYKKKEVVQSRLRAVFGETQRIPARLTQVRRIDKPTLDAFLKKNHLQVPTTAKYKYGLFLPKKYGRILNKTHPLLDSLTPPLISSLAHSEEVLVAAASFSGGKNILREGVNYRSFELIRFANVLDCTVVGGLGKLLKAFSKEINPDDIMTYADRDWSDGSSYERLGFERLGTTPPQAFYVNPVTFERHYAERLKMGEIPTDWIKIYNAGNWKFLKKLNDFSLPQ